MTSTSVTVTIAVPVSIMTSALQLLLFFYFTLQLSDPNVETALQASVMLLECLETHVLTLEFRI